MKPAENQEQTEDLTHHEQVRGTELRKKMLESEQWGEEFRATHDEDPTQGTQTGHKKTSEKKEIESR